MTEKISAIVELTDEERADLAKSREQLLALSRDVDVQLEAHRLDHGVETAKQSVLFALALLDALPLPGYLRPLIAGAVATLKLVISEL